MGSQVLFLLLPTITKFNILHSEFLRNINNSKNALSSQSAISYNIARNILHCYEI